MFTKLIETTEWPDNTPNFTYITNKAGTLVAYKPKDEWLVLDVPLKNFSTTRRKFKRSKHDTLEGAMV